MELGSNPRQRIGHLALLAIGTALLWLGAAHAQEGSSEYQRKASLICTIVRSTQWPAKKFAQADSPFVIGVYGTDAISEYLREMIQDRRFHDRSVVVKHLHAREELVGCHVLFVSRSERERLGPVLGEVRRENILTVGESDDFLDRGGVVNFVIVEGNVRYQINGSSARRERLTISGKLLQYAWDPRAAQTTVDLR